MLPLSQVLKNTEIITPRCLYRRLRKLWAEPSSDESSSEIAKLLIHPFVKRFEPSRKLCRLLGVRKTFEVSDAQESWALESMMEEQEMLSLPELCQLALLKVICGEPETGEELIQKLLVFLPFSALWAKEELYDISEFYSSAYLLYSYAGFTKKAALCKMAILGGKDPFFTRLEEELSFHMPCREKFSQDGSFLDKPTGTWISDRLAITLSGYGTSLGAFEGDGVEVRAFGPQFYPLTHSKQFGIQAVHKACSINKEHISGWTCCFNDAEVWLHIEAFSEEKLHVRWVGLTAEKKGAFVFYVKAKTAHVEKKLFLPKSLQRYQGAAKEIHFNEGALKISCRGPRQIELIPLAGEGCFWNSDFLVAFEMSLFDSEELFLFENKRVSPD